MVACNSQKKKRKKVYFLINILFDNSWIITIPFFNFRWIVIVLFLIEDFLYVYCYLQIVRK